MPAEPRADKALKVNGVVAEFHQSPQGQADGITLKDGAEIRFRLNSGKKVTRTLSIGDQLEFPAGPTTS